MHLGETEFVQVEWNQLVQDKVQCLVFMSTLIKLQVS